MRENAGSQFGHAKFEITIRHPGRSMREARYMDLWRSVKRSRLEIQWNLKPVELSHQALRQRRKYIIL